MKIYKIILYAFSYIKNQLDFGVKGNATGTWTFTPIDTTNTKVTWSTHIRGLKDLKTYIRTGKSVSVYPDSLNKNIKP